MIYDYHSSTWAYKYLRDCSQTLVGDDEKISQKYLEAPSDVKVF